MTLVVSSTWVVAGLLTLGFEVEPPVEAYLTRALGWILVKGFWIVLLTDRFSFLFDWWRMISSLIFKTREIFRVGRAYRSA